jgi:hypothetical protein
MIFFKAASARRRVSPSYLAQMAGANSYGFGSRGEDVFGELNRLAARIVLRSVAGVVGVVDDRGFACVVAQRPVLPFDCALRSACRLDLLEAGNITSEVDFLVAVTFDRSGTAPEVEEQIWAGTVPGTAVEADGPLLGRRGRLLGRRVVKAGAGIDGQQRAFGHVVFRRVSVHPLDHLLQHGGTRLAGVTRAG